MSTIAATTTSTKSTSTARSGAPAAGATSASKLTMGHTNEIRSAPRLLVRTRRSANDAVAEVGDTGSIEDAHELEGGPARRESVE